MSTEITAPPGNPSPETPSNRNSAPVNISPAAEYKILGLKPLEFFQILVALLILALAAYVVLSPGLVFAPAPRMVLFILIAFPPAILLGAAASSMFEMKLTSFLFTTTGAAAIFFGILLFTTYFYKHEQAIAVYQVYDEGDDPVMLDWKGALEIPVTSQGLVVNRYIDGNSVILIFPEQVGQAEMRVRAMPGGEVYSGMVGYAGSRTTRLILGKDLVAGGRAQ